MQRVQVCIIRVGANRDAAVTIYNRSIRRAVVPTTQSCDAVC